MNYLRPILRAGGPALAVMLLTGGCTHVPFDHDMRQRYQLTPETLHNVQFYTSGTIVLERRVKRQRGKPGADRQLVLQQTELIRQVVIPERTPGVVAAVHDDRLEIEFEPGASLAFGSTEKNRKRTGGLYYLLAKRGENGRGTVVYGGEVFQVRPGSGSVYLLVNARDIRRTKVVKKTVRGILATEPRAWLADPPFTEEEIAAETTELPRQVSEHVASTEDLSSSSHGPDVEKE